MTKKNILLLILTLGLLLPASAALAAARADLSVTRLTSSRPAQEPGGRLLLDFSLENLGNKAAENFYVRFFYTTSDMPGERDTPLTDKLVLRLEPGERLDSKVAIRLPQDIPTGSGYFVAVVDDAGAVTELSEANNTTKIPFTVGAQASPAYGTSAYGAATPAPAAIPTGPAPDSATPSGSDRYYGTPATPGQQPAPTTAPSGSGKANLVLTSGFIPPELYQPGQNMMVNFEVRNTGAEAVGRFFIAFCILDGQNTAKPSECPDRQMIQGLAPGTSHGEAGSMLVPLDIAPGTHKLGIIVDFDDQIAETTEGDNAMTLTFTTVAGKKTEDF